MNARGYLYKIGVLALLTCTFAACDGGGGGSSLPPVGPSIAGKWTGLFFIQGVPGSEEEIRASIRQDGDAVVIATTRAETATGHRLTGTIDESGEIFLTDALDGETWTTINTPATENFVEIADFRRDISDSAIAFIRLSR